MNERKKRVRFIHFLCTKYSFRTNKPTEERRKNKNTKIPKTKRTKIYSVWVWRKLFAHILASNLALFRLFIMKSIRSSKERTPNSQTKQQHKKKEKNMYIYENWMRKMRNWKSHIFHHHVLCSTTCQRYDCGNQNFITVCGGLPVYVYSNAVSFSTVNFDSSILKILHAHTIFSGGFVDLYIF